METRFQFYRTFDTRQKYEGGQKYEGNAGTGYSRKQLKAVKFTAFNCFLEHPE